MTSNSRNHDGHLDDEFISDVITARRRHEERLRRLKTAGVIQDGRIRSTRIENVRLNEDGEQVGDVCMEIEVMPIWPCDVIPVTFHLRGRDEED